jgi:2'-5' RNA ligase
MSRLFFALWPDPDTRAALVEVQQGVRRAGGRAVSPENLHITLLFIGAADEVLSRRLEAAAGAVTGQAFQLQLDRLGWWSGTRVTWLAPSRLPEALIALAARLRRAVMDLGVVVDTRPFSPHLTLYRRCRRGPRDAQPVAAVDWRPDGFCLVASDTRAEGARYEVLRHWPFAPSSH